MFHIAYVRTRTFNSNLEAKFEAWSLNFWTDLPCILFALWQAYRDLTRRCSPSSSRELSHIRAEYLFTWRVTWRSRNADYADNNGLVSRCSVWIGAVIIIAGWSEAPILNSMDSNRSIRHWRCSLSRRRPVTDVIPFNCPSRIKSFPCFVRTFSLTWHNLDVFSFLTQICTNDSSLILSNSRNDLPHEDRDRLQE